MIAQALIAASAAIVLVLGSLHLVFTFRGPKLLPRNPNLRTQMEQTTLVLTRETSVWKAWIGFNASHSLGLMLFGVVYGHLALVWPAVLQQSVFLLTLGAVVLLTYTWLARRYFFSVPFRGVVLALVLYLAGSGAALS